MDIMFFPVVLIVTGGIVSRLLQKRPAAAMVTGAGTLCGGTLAAIIMQILCYCHDGGFAVRDLFAFPVLILGLAGAIHSIGYLAGHGSERSGTYWFFFNLTAAAMLAVTAVDSASNPLSFLLAWEIMGAASFALVIFDRHNQNACRAGWIYMIACHAGAGLLILLFCFDLTPLWVFIIALLGFGLKIGFPLLHIWLPEAHPAAPAPVSALMSGAMIELGFYGLLSFGILRDGNIALYGWVLSILGMATMLPGIIFALAQNNLKRLLAYSSIENMGILSCALGLGFLGMSHHIPGMMICGFAGAAVHLLNHALFKGGLFLGAGSVYKAAGTLDMDDMGGLLKRMPWTGTGFILHAAGLCGLPPFAGFAGEFLIYCAAFAGLGNRELPLTVISAAVLVILAVTGGFAAAAFAKVIGAVFCGEPRSAKAEDTVEVSPGMILAVWMLFFLSCALLAALPCGIRYLVELMTPEYIGYGESISGMVAAVALFSLAGLLLIFAIMLLRRGLNKRCGERKSATWDCGYALPDPRMEYTATSFSRSMVDFFGSLLKPARKISAPQGIFPGKSELDEEIADAGMRNFWQPVFKCGTFLASRIHMLQSGSLHFYLLVLVITLIGMLLGAVLQGD